MLKGRGRVSDSPRRVMLTTDAVGGVWRYSLELAAGLIARSARVRLVTMGPAPSETQRAEAEAARCELRVTTLPLDWTADMARQVRGAAQTLASIAADWGADTIQLHAPALVCDAEWSAPVIAVAHSCVGTWWRAVRGDALPPDFAWRAALVHRGLLAADAIIAPSHSFARALADEYHLNRAIRVVPNGCRTRRLPRTPRPQALMAGRLWDAGKNLRVLDEAAGRLAWPVLAAGPTTGPNEAGIACQHIRLLGTLDEAALAREYAGATVFVSASLYEPFGLAVLEAARAGCALVLSNIPTFRELWDGAALFADPNEADGFAAALSTALAAPEGLAAAASERAEAYRAEAMVERTWAIHRELFHLHITTAA